MTDPLALVVDLGTSGPKVALVSSRGRLVARASRSVPTVRVGSTGAEQEPAVLWDAVKAAVREAVALAGEERHRIVGLLCVSQYSSIVAVDPGGEPLGNLLLWLDGRGAPHSREMLAKHPGAKRTWITHHGALPLPSGADSLSHILFLKNERPRVYDRARYFLEPMDFLTLRFTGEASTNLGSAFMMLSTDNREGAPLAWDPELLSLSGLPADKLPPLVPQRGRVGVVRSSVADELGLPPRTPVFASMNDTQAAAIGTGAFLPERGGLNIGTTCQVLAHRDGKGTDFSSHLVSAPSPLPGKHLILAENGLGGGALRFLVERVLFTEGAFGSAGREAPYEHLDRALASAAPGARGVVFLPWLAGALFPEDDPLVRGGFLNLSLETTREDLLRSVVEGVAVSLCGMIAPVERFAKTAFARLALGGGGALSLEWAQTLADVAQRPVERLAEPRFVNNLAGALVAFDGLGLADVSSAPEFVRTDRTLEPRPELAERYAQLAEHQGRAFAALQPLFGSMNGHG